MGGYLAYAEYKESGMEWLGEIPSHWEAKRLKFPVSLINEKVDAESSELSYMGLEHIQSWSGERIEDEEASSQGIASRFIPNDVLFGKLRPYLAKVYLSKHEGLASTEALVLRSKDELSPNFLRYYTVSRDFIDIVNSSTFGARMPRASWDFIGNLSLLIPPLEEQRSIARFLNYKTAQIDALIAKKETLLKKLAEKRTALISQAVTKECNRAVPMKDSGIEWLGEIPAHWSTPPLYARYSLELGKMLNESRISGEHLVPYLRNVDVQWDCISQNDLPEMDIRPNEYQRYLVQQGDLLACEGGEAGRAAIVPDIQCSLGYQKALHRLRVLTSAESPRFLYYTMFWAASLGVFLAGGNPNTIPHLTGEKLRLYRLPKPPLTEQKAIANFLDQQTAQLHQQVTQVKAVIDRLKEYRTAIITNAVTGKIDVRDVMLEPEPVEAA